MENLQGNNTVKRRTKGEITRKKILDAAIEVLAENGIKGTTHRAIAKHANLQLSLTTYYFKDIQELIHQAFTQSSEQTMQRVEQAWLQAFKLIESYSKTSLRKSSVKLELSQKLTHVSVQYLYNQICQQPTALAVEQLLFTEIQVTPALRELAEKYKKALLAPFITIAQYFNKIEPEIYADIMLTVYCQLEYRHLSTPPDNIDIDDMTKVVEKLIRWVMGIKA